MVDKVRNAIICKFFSIKSLLLQMKRSQFRFFGYVSRMPQERHPKQTLHAKVNEKRAIVQP